MSDFIDQYTIKNKSNITLNSKQKKLKFESLSKNANSLCKKRVFARELHIIAQI
ncbi:Hypothetical protein BN2458_PEG0114 [Helicobacter typhlonius]|uniref:Uncharacterized protein n=1 Tax=Helicobacter typhlonius TaxID=76936 RepID=A0A0S4PRZ8_9HELI|nr:Hypothetical protein BN2458_PEG0114 [Helicobacter typhlonius]